MGNFFPRFELFCECSFLLGFPVKHYYSTKIQSDRVSQLPLGKAYYNLGVASPIKQEDEIHPMTIGHPSQQGSTVKRLRAEFHHMLTHGNFIT